MMLQSRLCQDELNVSGIMQQLVEGSKKKVARFLILDALSISLFSVAAVESS